MDWYNSNMCINVGHGFGYNRIVKGQGNVQYMRLQVTQEEQGQEESKEEGQEEVALLSAQHPGA